LHFLARQFLDYEPGIHYPQIQMQSGTTASIQFGFIVQLKTQKTMILRRVY
jgi:hypothetical protein